MAIGLASPLRTRQPAGCRARLGIGMATLVFAGGCSSSIASQRTPEKIAAIEVGKTTKAEVVEILGLPNETGKETLEEGRVVECWVYYRRAGRSVIVAGPSVFRGGTRVHQAATLYFSEAGVVIDVQSPLGEKP